MGLFPGLPDADRAPVIDTVAVELFGVPSLLAGQRRVAVVGATLQELSVSLAAVCPALLGKVIDPDTGWLLGGYTFVLDERFTTDRRAPIAPTSAVLLVSTVAGG